VYGNKQERDFDNGFIYPLVNFIIKLFYYLNIVEILKITTKKVIYSIYRHEKDDSIPWRANRFYCNIIVDLFILSKFAFIFFIWWKNIDNSSILFLVYYLLLMNIFTYFYHHLWDKSAIYDKNLTYKRVRRRFIALFSSIAYMVICFSYLYNVPFVKEFEWSKKDPTALKSFLFSVSSSFSGSYENVKASSELGEYIMMSQVLMVFVFITLILARSMPQGNEGVKKEGK
jgi:hypothetical protein